MGKKPRCSDSRYRVWAQVNLTEYYDVCRAFEPEQTKWRPRYKQHSQLRRWKYLLSRRMSLQLFVEFSTHFILERCWKWVCRGNMLASTTWNLQRAMAQVISTFSVCWMSRELISIRPTGFRWGSWGGESVTLTQSWPKCHMAWKYLLEPWPSLYSKVMGWNRILKGRISYTKMQMNTRAQPWRYKLHITKRSTWLLVRGTTLVHHLCWLDGQISF